MGLAKRFCGEFDPIVLNDVISLYLETKDESTKFPKRAKEEVLRGSVA